MVAPASIGLMTEGIPPQARRIDKIAERLGVTIDYLVRGKEIKTDALSSQEMDLVEGFRNLTD